MLIKQSTQQIYTHSDSQSQSNSQACGHIYQATSLDDDDDDDDGLQLKTLYCSDLLSSYWQCMQHMLHTQSCISLGDTNKFLNFYS